jgi:excisionase family DNA binding protein
MPKLKVEVEIEDAVDTEEAAKVLGVGIATVWRWIAKGKLANFKVAGRTLIPKSEIERLKSWRR